MRLDRQPRQRGVRAVELVRQDTPEEAAWDSRKFLPTEITKWKELAALREDELTKDEKDRVIFSAWYALVDPEYNQLLQINPWVQKYAVDFFNQCFTVEGFEEIPETYTNEAYTALLPMIQAFPRLRQELKQQPGRENDFELVMEDKTTPTEERIVLLLQVWPEKKQEILRHFSAFDRRAAQLVLDNGPEDILDLESVKDVFLLFPETRKKIPLEEFKEKVKLDLQVANRFPNYRIFYPQLFNLILLSAASFEMDEHGQIHVEFEKKKLAQPEKLPERPQV